MSRLRALRLATWLLAAPAAAACAADLLQTFREALANDPVYAAARAARAAGLESVPQGLAQILPTISASAFTQYNDIGIAFRDPTLGSSHRLGNTNAFTVTLTQPVFNWQAFQLYREGGFKAAQAEASFSQAFQDLVIRVAQAYFGVLAAQDNLAFLQAQKTAIAQQLEQAKRNFEVGISTITDVNDAQARYDLAAAQEIAAQNSLEIAKRTLQQITGRVPEGLAPLREKVELAPPQPNSMEEWVAAAERQAYTVRAQEAAFEIAKLEVERSRSGHLPTLNLVGNVGTASQALSTFGTTNLASDSINRNIGLQLAIPIYSGGGVSSLVRQAIANREQAAQNLESARRQAALAARSAFLGVTSGMAQVKALEAALASSRASVESNKLGYEVGVRINIDVLNAEQQLYSTQSQLAQARYNTLIAGLQLKAAAGALGEADVEALNRLLASP